MNSGTTVELESPRTLAKRRQILDAARELFLSQGFESTSMDMITDAAGVSKRTLYKYFPGKEALLSEIVNQMTVGRHDGPPASLRDLEINSRDELERVLVNVALAIVENHRQSDYFKLVRLVIAEGPRDPRLIASFSEGVLRPGLTFLARIIDHAHERGVVRTEETDAVIRLFIGSIVVSSYENHFFTVGESSWLTPDQVKAQVKLLVAAIT